MVKRMNRLKIERNVAAVLFVLVLVLFSLAERDSRRLKPLYNGETGPAAQLRAETDSAKVTPLP